MSMLAPLRPEQHRPGRHVMILEHPDSVTGSSGRARMLARRRAALKYLAVAVGLSGLAAVIGGGLFVVVFAVAALSLCAYVSVLRRRAARAAEARRKTRALPGPRGRSTDAGAHVAPGAVAPSNVRVRRFGA